jgi:hypothetical protein
MGGDVRLGGGRCGLSENKKAAQSAGRLSEIAQFGTVSHTKYYAQLHKSISHEKSRLEAGFSGGGQKRVSRLS